MKLVKPLNKIDKAKLVVVVKDHQGNEKALPLKDGYYFEMLLPKAFFEGNPKAITLNWIDFYRN